MISWGWIAILIFKTKHSRRFIKNGGSNYRCNARQYLITYLNCSQVFLSSTAKAYNLTAAAVRLGCTTNRPTGLLQLHYNYTTALPLLLVIQ